MSNKYKTDLNNLNKLNQVNNCNTSPKVIKNVQYKNKNNPPKMLLEKSASLSYFHTNRNFFKKNKINSPKENNNYNAYVYKTNNNFYPKNRDNKLIRNINHSSDNSHPYNRLKYKNLEQNNNLQYSFQIPKINSNINYNNKFAINSQSYNQLDEYMSKNKNYRPYITENRGNNQNISYITHINPKIINNALYKQSKNNAIKDNSFINNNFYSSDPNLDLDDLIIMEAKFNDILIVLNNIRNNLNINALNECVEFFLFYFNSSLKNKFVLFFSEQNHIIIHSATNLMIFMILITYHLSLNPNMLNKAILILNNIFGALKINLYLFIKKIELYYGVLFCSKNEIYFNKFNTFLIKNDIYDISEREIIDIISRNCVHTVNDFLNILNYYKAINNKYYYDFHNIYLSLSRLNEEDLNDYFYNNILNTPEENINKNIKNNYNDNHNVENNNSIIEIFEEEDEEDEQYLNNIILLYKKNKANPPFLNIKMIKNIL